MIRTKCNLPKIMLTVACCFLVASATTVSSQTYEYDGQGRLTQVAYSDSMSVAYIYDNTSNILSTTVAGDVATSVLEPGSDVLPKVFALQQNYPNPFNPTTTIQFALPTESQVVLKIYNLLGREVATLVNEELQPGKYKVDFEANGLPSGVYFYRIQAGGFSKTRKLTLLK